MLPLDRCREILGPEGAQVSDHELAAASEAAWELARLLLDMHRPKRQPPQPPERPA